MGRCASQAEAGVPALTCQEAKLILAAWTSTMQAPKFRPLPSKMVTSGRAPQVSCNSNWQRA